MLNNKPGSLKKVLIISFVMFILISIGAFYYLKCERTVEIYDQCEVHSERETWGKAWQIIASEEVRLSKMNKFNIEIPENDFKKNYLLWSDGRKIKEIKFRIISKYQWQFNVPMGVATFEEKHYPHTAFIYKTNRVNLKRELE